MEKGEEGVGRGLRGGWRGWEGGLRKGERGSEKRRLVEENWNDQSRYCDQKCRKLLTSQRK